MHDTATGAGYGIGGAKGITGGRKGYKSALFEGGIGVPFIARWPHKIAAGKVDESSLVSAVDLLPTFCEVAGVKLPENYKPDGISQVSTLMGKASPVRTKPLFWKMASAWPIRKTQPYHWVSYAVVHENWKLLTNRDATHAELYDITVDPFETTNLSDSKPAVVSKLKKQVDQWKATLPESPSGNVFSSERR